MASYKHNLKDTLFEVQRKIAECKDAIKHHSGWAKQNRKELKELKETYEALKKLTEGK